MPHAERMRTQPNGARYFAIESSSGVAGLAAGGCFAGLFEGILNQIAPLHGADGPGRCQTERVVMVMKPQTETEVQHELIRRWLIEDVASHIRTDPATESGVLIRELDKADRSGRRHGWHRAVGNRDGCLLELLKLDVPRG